MALRPLFIPRGLVMLCSLWVFLCWVMLFGFRPPVQPQAASYGPSIEMLFLLTGVGIAIGWPLLRLSARPSSAPLTQAAIDGVSVLVLLQVVVWPLRLVTSWTLARAVALDAALGATILLTAALLAASQGSTSRRWRTSAMIVAVTLVLAPVLADAVFHGVGASQASPPWLSDTLHAMSAPALLAQFSHPNTIDPSEAERSLIWRAMALGCAGWATALSVLFVRQGQR